jgi:hypothetical protein
MHTYRLHTYSDFIQSCDGLIGLQVNLRVVTAETLRLGVETHVCEVQLILLPIAELKVRPPTACSCSRARFQVSISSLDSWSDAVYLLC